MYREKAMQVLGLSEGYSEDDLKKSYRRMAHKYHPDINKSSDATAMFMSVKESYDFLVKFKQVVRRLSLTHKSIFSVVKSV